ncbi:hypothetical protein KPL78_29505, partial [Roseomonas sp. HJA6]|nr:hypothetical protein [Neoroseomonas alba]
MTPQEFRTSLTEASPPAGLPGPLLALWWDARGDWDRAHEAAQVGDDADSAWVHAYLHRKEGGRFRKPVGGAGADVIRFVLIEMEQAADVGRSTWFLGCAGSA